VTAIAPPGIRRGETLGVCAPAGAVKPERLARGLARLGDTFRVRLAPTLTSPRAAGVPTYLANTDDARASELIAMLADPDVRAIVLARGGYGLMRILDRLDPDVLRRDPKPIVGFSDGTALLAWAHAAGVRGIHGPVIAQLGDLPDEDVERLIAALIDPAAPVTFAVTRVHGAGVIRGPLVPANLTMAALLAGTRWALPLAGALALFEEVGEKPYELDRYLTRLALAGEQPAGVVLGELVRCEEPKLPEPEAALAVFRERLAALPLATGMPVGHGTRNAAVAFGAPAELDLEHGELRVG
jgi:muramoyltetrapeptide carboxypeptidase